MNKEEIRNYISIRDKRIEEFNAKIKAQDEVLCEALIKDCPVKVGDIYRGVNTGRAFDNILYKVTEVKPYPDGTIKVIGVRTKINGEFGLKEYFMFYVSYVTDYKVPDEYTLVDESM